MFACSLLAVSAMFLLLQQPGCSVLGEIPSDSPLSFQTPTSRKPRSSTLIAGRGGTWAPSTQSCRTCRGLWWPTSRKSYSEERPSQVQRMADIWHTVPCPRVSWVGRAYRRKGLLIPESPEKSCGLGGHLGWISCILKHLAGTSASFGPDQVSHQLGWLSSQQGQAPEHCR